MIGNTAVFKPDYLFWKNLPDPKLLFNPLTDISPYQKEDSELSEFYKLSNEYYSPEFGIKYLLNVELFPYQMAIIRAMLLHKFPLLLLSRGGGKTFLLAVFGLFYAAMNPGCRIILVSRSFRQSKLIFSEIKRIYEKAPLLRSICDDAPTTSTDRCYITVNGSTITALPLGQGDKIRGERAHVTLVDEFDSVPIEIFDVVIRGFSATESDPYQKAKEVLLRDQGIIPVKRIGPMAEGNKIILSGTAGFRNGTLYRLFGQYSKILSNKIHGKVKEFKDILGDDIGDDEIVDYRDYCICRFRYTEIPPGAMDMKMIHSARASMPVMLFNMEYLTEFGDDSSGFFKHKDIVAATSKAPDGFQIRLIGLDSRRYILGIDPARTNDRFAIVLIEVGQPNKLVYSWTCHKKTYAEATRKIVDLLEKFNVIGIAMDAGGGGLAIEENLRSPEFIKSGMKKIYRHDSEEEESKLGNKILYMMDFSSNWIEEANTLLQKNIEDKKLMFPMDVSSDNSDDADETIDNIDKLKKELVCIEVTYTKTGRKSFDLMPAEGRKQQTGPEEVPRHKDRYSSLLLANYLASRYGQLNGSSEQDKLISIYHNIGGQGGYLEDFGY